MLQKTDKELHQRSNRDVLFLAGLTAAVCLIVFIAHLPALPARAECFDDEQYLIDNKLVKNPGWASAGRFLSEILRPSTVRGYYQPLSMISLI